MKRRRVDLALVLTLVFGQAAIGCVHIQATACVHYHYEADAPACEPQAPAPAVAELPIEPIRELVPENSPDTIVIEVDPSKILPLTDVADGVVPPADVVLPPAVPEVPPTATAPSQS